MYWLILDMCLIGAILGMIDTPADTPQASLVQEVTSVLPRPRPLAGDLRFVIANEHEESASPRGRPFAGTLACLGASLRGDRLRGASLFLRPGARVAGCLAAALPAVLGRSPMADPLLRVSPGRCADRAAALWSRPDGLSSRPRSNPSERATGGGGSD